MIQITKKSTIFLVIVILTALLLRVATGAGYFNSFDTYWYRNWAVDLPNGLFSVYARAEDISLDYPPLYLFCLYLTGLAYRVIGTDCGNVTQMLLMKFWPIFFDMLCIVVLYLTCRKYGENKALIAAALWAFNPSVFFNTAFWGQTDQIMALLLLLTFDKVQNGRAVQGCTLFAVAGLTKFQSLFFTPVLLIELYYRCGIKKLLMGILAAAATVAAVFLPFMIGARDPFLFFNVYLGGAGQYKYCTLNAFNLYGLLGLNWVSDETTSFAGVPVSKISLGTTAAIIVFTVLVYIFAKRRNVYVGGLMFMECIFMLTSRMHERYQVVVLPFALMAYISIRRKQFLYSFCMLSIVTFVNQAALLLYNNNSNIFYAPYYQQLMQVVSAVNLVIFVYVMYVCTAYFLVREED